MPITPKIKETTSYKDYLNSPNWINLPLRSPIEVVTQNDNQNTFVIFWKPVYEPEPATTQLGFYSGYIKSEFIFTFNQYDSKPYEMVIASATGISGFSTVNPIIDDIHHFTLFTKQSTAMPANYLDIYLSEVTRDAVRVYKFTSTQDINIQILAIFQYKGA